MPLPLFLAFAAAASALGAASAPPAPAADALALDTRIADVTVYPTSALVHRTGRAAKAGEYVIGGLPQALDPASVRVRCETGAVLGVEVRQRMKEAAPSERIDALRKRLEAARAEQRVATDRQATLKLLEGHLMALLRVDEQEQRRDTRDGRASPETWEASWSFAAKKLGELKGEQREADRDTEQKARLVAELERELGSIQGQGAVPVHDVLVEIETPSAGTRVDVEYLVSGTGWKPLYDLRAAADVSAVDLTYRARVWQRSGEDWEGVQLALSTAQPQRGAQGPEPQPIWVSLWEPPARARRAAGEVAPTSAAPAERPMAGFTADGAEASEAWDAKDFEAGVEVEGLSARFALPRPENVQSRDEPTTVLVGQARLEVKPERWCVPALDTTVWLRGRAKNTSEWTLLPGAASVFIGRDFLGQAELETVQTGQEFTLHLGADPAITVERIQTQDLAEGPGFLSSRATKTTGWRIHLENHGAMSARPDGSVELIVREVLPRSRDERIEVELGKASPEPSKDERWKQERAEKGFVTWVLSLGRDAKADVNWECVVSYPKDSRIVFQ